jgi:non-ribosomal peptide synthetase component F
MAEFLAFDDAAIEESIPERFAWQAARHPDRFAVVSTETALTYAEPSRVVTRRGAMSPARAIQGLLNVERRS